MADLLSKWGGVGFAVAGDESIDPLQDPEKLVAESLSQFEKEPRLLSAMASWLWRFGYLLIVRKLELKNDREKRLFLALWETAGHKAPVGSRWKVSVPMEREYFYKGLGPSEQKFIRSQPNPHFKKYGFWLPGAEIIRPKTLYRPQEAFRRSRILRFRSLLGADVRSDVLAVLPGEKETSLRALAKKLNVSLASIQNVVRDYVASEFVTRKGRAGRNASIAWNPRIQMPTFLAINP